MKRKPHIALILPDRIEHPVGGMGVQAKYIIKHLEKDFTFSVHGFPDDTSLSYYHNVFNPLPIIQHGGLNTLNGQVAYFASIMDMVEDKGENSRPDIIHALDYTVYLAGVYASKVLKVPLVISMQLSAHLMYKANLFFAREPNSPDGIAIENSMKEMELVGFQEAKSIIHVSKHYMDYFAPLGLQNKSVVIPNGIDIKEWGTFTKRELPGNGRIKLVYIGRIAQMKGVNALCQSRIPAEIDLIFIGKDEGGDKAIFDAVMEKVKNAPNVHYLGPLFGQDKIDALRSADAVIMPSLHEPFGIVALEALASESILLASFVDGMRDFLTEDVAINCGTDAQSIENALARLLVMSQEEKIQRKSKGLKVAEDYSWEKSAEKTKDLYNSLYEI
jgi:glycosyltransferase involved in cell wall biosynthesis